MKTFVLMALLGLSACENLAARSYGGSMVVQLPPGQKLVGATWKDSDLWYITRPMRAGESPEEVTMRERSLIGAMEGTVTFVEKR